MQNLNFFCKYCGLRYDKEHKPFIMTCSHNICSKCLKLNSKVLLCLDCQAKYVKNKIKHFPINFLLFEICSASNNNTPPQLPSNKKFHCENCNLFLPTDYHRTLSPDHNLIEIQQKSSNEIFGEVDNKKKELLLDFNDINYKTNQLNSSYFDCLITKLKEISNSELDFSDIDKFTVILTSGIINPADRDRLKKFYEKIISVEENKKLLLDSTSFNDLVTKLNSRQNQEVLPTQEFISLLFYFYEIYKKKLVDFPIKIAEIKDKMSNELNIKTFLNEFILNINYSLGDFLLSNKFKTSSIKIGNSIVIFEPIEEKFSVYNINIENKLFKDSVSYCITNNKMLYVFDGNYVYQYNLETGKTEKLQKPNFSEEKRQLIFVDDNLYLLSAHFFEKLCINQEITKNEWKILTTYKGETLIQKPKVATYAYQSFFVFDEDAKECKEFYGYEINSKKWKKFVMKFNDITSLYLNQSVLFFYGQILIFGGYDKEKKKWNENLYEINKNSNKVSIAQRIEYVKEKDNNWEVYGIDVAYKKLDNIYFIVCYRGKGEENEKNYLLELWKKNGKNEEFVKTEISYRYRYENKA